MTAAHARVQIPRSTQIAPTVSMAIRMTANIEAKGNPRLARKLAVAPIPRWNLAMP
jgi:hypothetical protein